MPLIKELHTEDGAHIMVWKDEEELSFFLEKTILNEKEVTLLNKYKVERRKKELIIARHLLQKQYPLAEIIYHDSGKPYLKGGEAEISISHSRDLVTLITHKKRSVAIDIEYISSRVERVKKRFLSDKELKVADSTTLLILYWSAKETLFKLDKKQGLEFDSELSITPLTESTMLGGIRGKDEITINYIKNKSWVMTHACL